MDPWGFTSDHPAPLSASSVRIHALKCPPDTSRNGGSSTAHAGSAYRHLVRNRHPDGGFTGLGGSPASMMRCRPRPGSGVGAADSSASV